MSIQVIVSDVIAVNECRISTSEVDFLMSFGERISNNLTKNNVDLITEELSH